MTLYVLLAHLIVLPCIHASLPYQLAKRSIQSNAVCSNNFTWMDNGNRVTPCLVAAYVNAACRGGDYTVPSLSADGAGSHYTVPTNVADLCSCSWASYNLLSACTVCQGQEKSVPTWAEIRDTNCSSLQTKSYFPPDTPIAGGQTIPSWAGTDPTNWQDGIFNAQQAEVLAAKGNPDLKAPSSQQPSGKKSSPIGAIVGGVVGGVAIIVLGVFVAVYINIRQRRMRNGTQGQSQNGFPRRPLVHGRSFSDISQKTATTSYQFTPALETVPASPTAPTIRTHSNSSTHSLSYFGSAQGSVFSMPLQTVQRVFSGTPALPPGASPPVGAYPQDVITPFNINPSSPPPTSPSSTHRKLASESSDTTIPVSRVEEGSIDAHASVTGTPQRRLNPPAYTASVYGSQSQPGQPHTPNLSSSELSAALRRETRGHAHRPIRETKGSQDSQSTWDSTGGNRSITQDSAPLVNRIAMSLAGRGNGAGPPPMMATNDEDHDDIPVA